MHKSSPAEPPPSSPFTLLSISPRFNRRTKMARNAIFTTAIVLALCCCAAGVAQAQITAGACTALFNSVGGVAGATRFLPACVPGDKFNQDQCCTQAKSALNLAPQVPQCLCNVEVWKEVSTQAGAAGFGGTLTDFVKRCDIKVAGLGC